MRSSGWVPTIVPTYVFYVRTQTGSERLPGRIRVPVPDPNYPDPYPDFFFAGSNLYFLADADVSSDHPLQMYGGQTAVPCGCTYLLPWGWRFMVKQQNTKKLIFSRFH